MSDSFRDWIERQVADCEGWLQDEPDDTFNAGAKHAYLDVIGHLDQYPEGTAPDLLEACEAIYGWFRDHLDDFYADADPPLEKLNQAIAKARGTG